MSECDWCLTRERPTSVAGTCGERLCANCMPTHRELWSDPNDWSLPSRGWRG